MSPFRGVSLASVLFAVLFLATTLSAFLQDEVPLITEIEGVAKRAINPFMDSIGKRSGNVYVPGSRFYRHSLLFQRPSRYFDSLAGQSLGRR
ncbi:unnamed protein product [Bursaphelenchus xylophilus]|uniref:(pine wood nematode) hypothetical protein n=1 Tax=Bursaphelenchus xylophilus TaxID=6326 RepID=A0A1I7SS37_BURXY|nr:unnamed protein product [Bursaphelenchus xylophilus]CAG9105721.1 unnamed protein product [Bursaphelenchus xylophilus]